jgi:hypothetical protein
VRAMPILASARLPPRVPVYVSMSVYVYGRVPLDVRQGPALGVHQGVGARGRQLDSFRAGLLSVPPPDHDRHPGTHNARTNESVCVCLSVCVCVY